MPFRPIITGGRSCSGFLLLLLSFLTLITFAFSKDDRYIQSTTASGETVYLADGRKPALYTQDFGDCLGSSLINVTRFDAAYYQDNMTVLFHLEGNTNVANESIMSPFTSIAIWIYSLMFPVYIGVIAYGESRFDLTFNPCSAQISRYWQSMIPSFRNTNVPQSLSHE